MCGQEKTHVSYFTSYWIVRLGFPCALPVARFVVSKDPSRPLPSFLPSFLPLSLPFSGRDTKYQKPPNADEDPGWRILDLAFGFAAAAFPPTLPVTPLTASSLASSIDVLARTPLLARADVNRDRGCDGLAGGMSSMPVWLCVVVCVCVRACVHDTETSPSTLLWRLWHFVETCPVVVGVAVGAS